MSSALRHRTSLVAFAVLFSSGLAMAQTSTSQTVITTTPSPAGPVIAPIVPPPVGTLSTTTTEQKVLPNGTRINSESTTYRNTQGVAQDSLTRTTIAPPPPPPTTTTQTDTTVTVIKR
jgi:hypothetical protein